MKLERRSTRYNLHASRMHQTAGSVRAALLAKPMKLTSEEYIAAMYSMFGGPDETEIRCRTVSIVKVRNEHPCMCPAHRWNGELPDHIIRRGDVSVRDKAIADGRWGSCYVCLPCLKSWHEHCEKGEEYCTVKSA